ncbi:MAG: ISLre2 family transposase [Clostridia bacterium]|nr:ISLre2 family transposase [Clostridia bacterium]
MPRLVYVHEGYEECETKRRKLSNVYHFSGVYKDSEELWLEVVNYIESNYEMKEIEKIYLSGDGAAWIKEGLNWLPKAKYVLDRYHLNKYVLQATGHVEKLRFELWEGLNLGDKEKVKEVFKEIMSNTVEESKKRAVQQSRSYIYNNWNGIENYIKNADVIGCSAEGHVSHILSDRLSSRPMGWCEVGVDQMSRLRAFKSNGGSREDIYDLILSKEKELKKEENISKIVSKMSVKKLKNRFIERKENIPVLAIGKRSPLFKALRSIS